MLEGAHPDSSAFAAPFRMLTSAASGGDDAAPRLPPVALLVGVTVTGPIAMHLFVPSMPGLVEAFSTTPGRVQLTLTVYMLALAAATLVYGPLSDRYGRRPIVLAGLAVYAIAAVFCALATSIDWLIAGRALQAVGGCAGLVLGRTMVRDCFDRDRAAGGIAALTMVMSVVPALSPALGGYLDVWAGWRAGFVLLAVYGAVVLAAAGRWLNETNRYVGSSRGTGGHLAGFHSLVREREFAGYGLHCVCTLSAWYTTIAGAPYVMVTVMGHPPSDYGVWFILVAAGWTGGNFLTSRIARRVGAARMVLLGALVAIASCLGLLALVARGGLTPTGLFVPLAIMGVGQGLSQPSALAAAIGVRPELAGRASGLVGFVQMSTGAAAAQLLGAVQGESAWPLAIMIVTFSVLSLGCWVIAVTASAKRTT